MMGSRTLSFESSSTSIVSLSISSFRSDDCVVKSVSDSKTY